MCGPQSFLGWSGQPVPNRIIRIGQATDVFNTRWAALSVQLSEAQRDLRFDPNISLKSLGRMWAARDDARNFMIMGDPAVRLRVEDLPQA